MALLKLENDLRRAIERKEFQVYYQPIICLESNELYGFESLVRWNHPERGLVMPDTFIPVAEETGLILEIGQQVFHESCRQMREWHLSSPDKPLTISVNLSAKQFAQPDLISVVRNILEDTGLEAEYVKLEITESVVMKNAEIATTMLMELCALGVNLSIDDFGTGYSSLSYLHRFPVTTLKIDRSFIGRMGQGGENSEIVRTINTLAQNLGMAVVAEGVETLDQLIELKSMNCYLGQGYLFARPMDAKAANAFIQNHQSYALSALIGDGLIQSQLDLLN
jgi:EAL domain-containing protein (putative c-di-GMP-specific phosphodiesterase class I)